MDCDNRAEAVNAVKQGVNQIAQPFPIAPSAGDERERKEPLLRYRVMTQDPLAGADVNSSDRIDEQRRRVCNLPIEQRKWQKEYE